MPEPASFTVLADESDNGRRLDVVVASHIQACSRSLAASLIVSRNIVVDGCSKKPGYRVKTGDRIAGEIPAPVPVAFQPEAIDLSILYEDEHLVVINKQPGLVVHPAPGHLSGTLVNALLHHCPDLKGIGGELRPGIVHRLDRDTSGTMVVAKTATAHETLAHQFKCRRVKKTYLALVHGQMLIESGVIELPIGRHPVDRKKMSTTSRKHRTALTQWRIREKLGAATLLEVNLKTGRTHQIRVHCAAIGHPVVGDSVYGSRAWRKSNRKSSAKDTEVVTQLLLSASRQMLHAWRLGFDHPQTGEWLQFEAPVPDDMQRLIQGLRKAGKSYKLPMQP